jgi:hypothetical protein
MRGHLTLALAADPVITLTQLAQLAIDLITLDHGPLALFPFLK